MNEHRGLWRGKRVDNGEWVEGYLSKSRNTSEKPALLKWCIDYEEKGVMMSCIVDPSTLGECTGLRDKNGKLIFEGDIVSVVQGKDKGTAIISYEHGSFVAVPVTGNIYERTLYDYWYNDWEIQLISNIHDNPELLNTTDDNIENAAQNTIAPAT